MDVFGHGLPLPLNRQSLDLATGPLINFGGASAAYSLRDLNGRNPRVVRVRRASDNLERDFYEDGVNSGELVDWVGAGNDGFVETWYDQSGNGNDAVQVAAGSQPKIVNSGEFLGEVEFDGSNDVLETTNSDLSNQSSLSLFSVLQGRTAAGTRYAVSAGSTISGSSNYGFGGWAFASDGYGDAFRFRTQEAGNGSISSLDSQVVGTGYYSVTSIINDADGSIFKDGQVNETISTLVTPNSINESRRRLRIGCFHPSGNTFFYQGGMKEIILYTSDQSANRPAIEANINNQYDIY